MMHGGRRLAVANEPAFISIDWHGIHASTGSDSGWYGVAIVFFLMALAGVAGWGVGYLTCTYENREAIQQHNALKEAGYGK
jgi:hypothetical protein